MIADATHSLSDLLTDLVVFFGLSAAGKPADSRHPYGHGKIEAVLSAVCGISLLLAAGGIFFSGAARIWSLLFRGAETAGPGIIALAAAGVSVLLKEWLFRYTIEGGRRLQSSALIARHGHAPMPSLRWAAWGIAGAFFGGNGGKFSTHWLPWL